MKTRYKLAIAVVAGAAVGGFVVQEIHAQATPPTYAIIDISSVTDAEGYKALFPKAGRRWLLSVESTSCALKILSRPMARLPSDLS